MTTDLIPRDTLLHVTDIHFWEVVKNPLLLLNKRFLGNLNVWLRRRHEFAIERAEPFADTLAETGIDQVLITGDFTSTATERECAMGAAFVRGLESRGLSVRLFAGNHDVYTFESVRKRRFERHFGQWLPKDGLPAAGQLAGGVPLVMAPTVCPNVLSSKGRITDPAAEAVGGLVASCSGPVIVAGHYPVLFETAGYRSKSSRRLRNARALREVMGTSKKRILYVAGHEHRFSYTQDAAYSELSHLTTGAFVRNTPVPKLLQVNPGGNLRTAPGLRSSQGEFSEIHIYDNGFKVRRWVFGTEGCNATEVGPS